MISIEINGYRRVTKPTARRLYNSGKTIRLCPVKCNPCNEYYPMSLDVNKDDKFEVEPFDWELKFDTRVNRFEYYNCQYAQLGKYAAFYVKELY